MVKPQANKSKERKVMNPYRVNMVLAKELFPEIFVADLKKKVYNANAYTPVQALAWAWQKEGYARKMPNRLKDRASDIVECLYKPPEEKEPYQLRLF